MIPASCLTKRCAEQHLKTHRNLIHLLVEFRVWHDPPAEGLQLREAGVVGRLLEVLRVLVEPHVDGLAQRAQAVLPHPLPHGALRVAQEIVPEMKKSIFF